MAHTSRLTPYVLRNHATYLLTPYFLAHSLSCYTPFKSMEAFFEISFIIVIAAAVALVFQLLRQPLILGHIITGILVGPAVLNIIKSQETLTVFSQLGITALLFIVGLSLSPQVMREVGKVSLITGIGQVVFTSIFGYFIGRAFGFSAIISIYLAVAFTFSSTIIISKLLFDKKDTWKLYGKIAIGFLLVQDVLATFFLILASAAKGQGSMFAIAMDVGLKAILIGSILYIMAAYVLPLLTNVFAKSQEFLFLFTIGWGVGLAAIFYGLGLSIELGALAAGVTLAASPYHYEISAKMKILRDFFIVTFFILLGSQLSPANLYQFLWPAIAFSAFILIGNPLIVMVLMGLLGYNKKTGFLAGLTVAQISEFSLILIILGIKASHIPSEILSLATIVGIVTISFSTIMILYSESLYAFFEPILGVFERKRTHRERGTMERFDIILFGCHRVGSDFLPSLEKSKKSFLVVDFDPAIIRHLAACGIPNRYGDAEDNEFLDSLNLKKTELVISTLPDFEANMFIVNKVRKANPNAMLIALGHTIPEAEELYAEGATYVILPHYIGGNYAAMLVEKHAGNLKKFAVERQKHLKHLLQRKAHGCIVRMHEGAKGQGFVEF